MEEKPKPKDWSKIKSAILKKYPNLTKTQISQLDAAIKKRQVEEVVRAGVIAPKDIATEYPDVAARLANEGVQGAPTEKDKAAEGVLGVVDQLKESYNQTLPSGQRPDPAREQDLSFGEEGSPSFLASLGANYEILLNKAPNAKTYKRIKDAFTASLKELTGDTGILTDQDFKRLNNALPNFGDDDKSATGAWRSFDEILESKLGKSGKYSYARSKAEIQADPLYQKAKEGEGIFAEGQMSSPTPGAKQSSRQGKEPIAIEEYQESPFMKSLAGIQNFIAKSPLFTGVATVAGSGAGPLGTAVGTIAGRQLQDAAKMRGEGKGLVESLVRNPLNPEDRKKSVDDLKAAGLAATIDQFFRGGGVVGNLSKLRGSIANRSTAKITGDTIAEAAMKAAQNAPTSLAKPAQRTAMQAIDSFGGKTLSLPEAIAARTASGTASRGLTSGTVKAGGANLVEDAIRGALRGQIRGSSKSVGFLDDILSKFMGTKRGVGRLAKPATNIIGTAVLFDALRRFGYNPNSN